MPKNIIPIENKKPVAEVRYLENPKLKKDKKVEIPSANNNQTKPLREAFKNLTWKNPKGKEFYRVFGSWKCDNKKKCGKGWKSAYTWILLQKYRENTPLKKLDKNKDYYQQECKACNSKINSLVKYEHLERNDNEEEIKPHRSDLCAKCKTGAKCWDFMKYQQQVHYRTGSKFLLGLGKRFFRV